MRLLMNKKKRSNEIAGPRSGLECLGLSAECKCSNLICKLDPWLLGCCFVWQGFVQGPLFGATPSFYWPLALDRPQATGWLRRRSADIIRQCRGGRVPTAWPPSSREHRPRQSTEVSDFWQGTRWHLKRKANASSLDADWQLPCATPHLCQSSTSFREAPSCSIPI